MTTPYDIDLNLNASDYVTSATAALNATNTLNSSLGALGTTAIAANRALAMVTPGRAMTAGLAASAAAAARFQQQMSNLQSTAVTTGADFGKMSSGVREMARSFPIGTAGARGMYEMLGNIGVAGRGTEAQMKSLAQTFTRLQGATGESGANLGAGMAQLDRAFSAGALDPKRIAGMSDSLVQVSKSAGASAGSIVNFSKMIAPMAQAAGIGQNATLGISAAFARMGEDGFGAANAMNKMMGDLNRSIREGSSDMNAYANILGTTATNLKAMYQANPAEVITQVTEAIAKGGGRGPRMLESLGLEGVRTQRALQALSASGGLRSTIDTAVSATGGGANEKAARSAFGGLNDSLIKLSSTAGQAGEALGRPLLGPLNEIISIASKPINIGRGVLDSRVGQTGLSAGLLGGGALAAAALVAGKLLTGTLLAQMLTASPLRGAIGGYGLGRAGMDPAAMGRFSSFVGGRVISQYDRGMNVGGATSRLIGYGAGVGERMPSSGGPGMLRQVGRTLVFGGQVYSQAVTESARAVRLTGDPAARAALPGVLSPAWFRQIGSGLKTSADATATLVSNAEKARRAANEVAARRTAGVPIGPLTQQQTTAAMAGTPIVGARRAALSAGADIFRQPALAVGRGLGVMAGAFGGPLGLSLMGASLGGMQAFQQVRKDRAERQAVGSDTVYSTLNAYLTSMGKATEATLSLSDAMRSAAATQANMATSISQAMAITDADISAATASRSQQVRKFTGSDTDQLAAQVLATQPNGMTPSVLAANKMDLLRQFDPGKVRDIMEKVSASNVGNQGDVSVLMDNLIAAAGLGGSNAFMQGMADFSGGSSGKLGSFGGLFKAGAALGPSLGKQQTETVRQLADVIEQRANKAGQDYGPEYGTQQRFREMNEAMAKASATGDDELVARMSQIFSNQLMTGNRDRTIRREDLSGTNFVERLASMESEVNDQLKYLRDQGGDLTGTGRIRQEQMNPTAAALNDFGPLGYMFDNRSFSEYAGKNQPVLDALMQPENKKMQDEAIKALVAGALSAGSSLEQVADSAIDAAAKVGSASDAFALLQGVLTRVQMINAAAGPGRTPGQNAAAQMALFRSMAGNQGTSPEDQSQRLQGEQGQISTFTAQEEQLKAFLISYRQYEVQRSRMARDFNTQRVYATNDFTIAAVRQQDAYELQIMRSERNFERSRLRAVQDFALQRKYAEFDYLESVRYATFDFHLGQRRAQADFNRQMAYMAEDGAASMYDPYERVKVKGVWDAKNLLSNVQQQAKLMEDQRKNLDQLRKMGVSTDVIDLLGLSKADNAQQLGIFLANLTTDPSLVAEFNKSAASREKLASDLLISPDNKDYRRAKEEFERQADRQQDDFDRMQNRQSKAYDKQLERNRKAFNLTMRRAGEDFEISMADMATDYNTAVDHAQQDFNRQLRRSSAAFDLQLADMATDFRTANEVIAAEAEDLAEATMKAMNGEVVDWTKLIKNGLTDVVGLVRGAVSDVNNITTSAGGGAASSAGGAASSGSAGGSSRSQYSPGSGKVSLDPMRGWGVKGGDGGIVAKGSAPEDALKKAVDFARSIDTATYLMGGFSRSEIDCSGLVAAAANVASGRDPFSGRFSTESFRGKPPPGWLSGGGGAFSIGVAYPGEIPGNQYGHMAATINGVNIESNGGTGVEIGGSARGAGDKLFKHRYHLSYDSKKGYGYAKGGVFSGRSGQIIEIAEGGVPEVAIPLDNRGVEAMAAAMSKYAGRDALRSLAPGMHREVIVYHGEQITYDHSNDFDGAVITVQAQDPDEMLRKLEERKRRSNLTNARASR